MMGDLDKLVKSALASIAKLVKRTKEVQPMTVTLSRKYKVRDYETYDVSISVTRMQDTTKPLEPQVNALRGELEDILLKNDPILGPEAKSKLKVVATTNTRR